MNRAGLLIVIAALLLAVSSVWLPAVAQAEGQQDRVGHVVVVTQ